MAWWNRSRANAEALTAAAQILQGPDAPSPSDIGMQRQLHRTPDEWQRECWDFYDTLGEFRQGVTWKANLLSRVRLRAAKKTPGQDEPLIVNTGPANDLISELAGGVGGQAELMRNFAVHLEVPGECYLIGETKPNGTNDWYTRSIEEVRRSITSDGSFSVVDQGISKWRDLPANSMVSRIWRPHERWHFVANSPARAARPLMRELELINRHIQAQYLSRLASAGVVIFPDEITFPVRPEFQDAPDPFVSEWIEIASEAIKTPGTAAGVVPIPIRVPGEYVDKIKHVDFTLKLDAQIVDKRDSALARLAIMLDMPPEALLGTRTVSHWGAWLIDEQGVKVHVAPSAETICAGITTGYLIPRLKAAGEDPDEWVCWYDASELILRPDRSAAAQEAYDRVELTGEGLRRETGFDESDKPDDDERKRIILTKASLQPVNTFAALDELGYKTKHDTPVNEPRPAPGEAPGLQGPAPPGPPPMEEPTKPAPKPKTKNTAGLTETLVRQSKLMHAIKIDMDGVEVMHPPDCRDHLFSCPVTHAMYKPPVNAHPGTSGLYECWLNASGRTVIGSRIVNGSASDMIKTTSIMAPFKTPVG